MFQHQNSFCFTLHKLLEVLVVACLVESLSVPIKGARLSKLSCSGRCAATNLRAQSGEWDNKAWGRCYETPRDELAVFLDAPDLPPDLIGTYFRNGAAKFDVFGEKILHPFDADGEKVEGCTMVANYVRCIPRLSMQDTVSFTQYHAFTPLATTTTTNLIFFFNGVTSTVPRSVRQLQAGVGWGPDPQKRGQHQRGVVGRALVGPLGRRAAAQA
jgi:hypothetical protein